MGRKVVNMLFGIEKVRWWNEEYYSDGIKFIENAKKSVKDRKTVDFNVLNGLDSIKNFWTSNNFFTEYSCKPLSILKNELKFFHDKRRKMQFSDCEQVFKDLLDKLGKCIVEEKDLEDLKEIYEKEKEYESFRFGHGETMTSQNLIRYIDYRIRKFELSDKYTDSNSEKEISKYQFVKEKIQEFGTSDSYMAQVIYKYIQNELDYTSEYCYGDMSNLILILEVYSFVVKESTDSREELLLKFSPCKCVE